MKFIIFFFSIFYSFSAAAQNIVTKEGEFMDTPSVNNSICTYPAQKNIGPMYYYSVGAKYPRSSQTLLKEGQEFLAKKNANYSGSGYISFRFTIDCNGKMLRKIQVLQTDELYKSNHFDKLLVSDLFAYLQTLDQWKIIGANYMAFITFKIRNGKIINIMP